MSRIIRFCGIAGLLLLVFGQISWFAIPSDNYHFFPLHTALGGALLLVYLAAGGWRTVYGAARRRSRHGLRAAGFWLLYAVMIAAANFAAYRAEFFRWDSTAEDVYTLAPETKALIEQLPHRVVIRGFFFGGRFDNKKTGGLISLLENSSSGKIRFEMIDPEKQVSALSKYGISNSGTLHLSFDEQGSTKEVKLVNAASEQDIANALKKLSRGEARKVYYITGHGEPELTSNQETGYLYLRDAIAGENIEIEPLAVGRDGAVPGSAAAVILAAPKQPLLQRERELLSDYLAKGGNMLLLNEPQTSSDIMQLARLMGIETGKDVIVSLGQAAGSLRKEMGVEPMVTDYGQHEITAGFDQGTLFVTASSVSALPADSAFAPPAGAKVVELAKTSMNSWAERNLDLLFSEVPRAALEPGDIRGPVPVAAAYDGSSANTMKGRTVVIGDADFVANLSLRQLFNRDFFLNCLNWVIGESKGITIRERTLHGSTKRITSGQLSAVFSFSAILFPELLMLLGFIIWLRRNG